MEESGDTFTSTATTTEAIFSTSTVPCPVTVVDKTQATIAIMSISLFLSFWLPSKPSRWPTI